MTEDEEFYAWLDGQLDADTAAKVEARVAASTELTSRATKHRRLSTSLQKAFAPVLAADVPPPRFAPANIIDFGARAFERERRPSRFGLPHWAAMAATLALGLLIGNLASQGAYSPVAVEGSRLIAAGSLDQALDKQLPARLLIQARALA